MHYFKYLVGLGLLLLAIAGQVSADQSINFQKSHAQAWNEFADKTLQLHEQLIKKIDHSVKSTTGGYAGMPDFYKEDSYYDKKTNQLISRLQWERENPQNLHAIEVYVRDDKGRVLRDFIAAYLPTYRNAPTQTLISLHAYNGKLHALRTFDASGARILERCTGMLGKVEVNMLLDEDEIYAGLEGRSKVMKQKDYQTCFKGLPEKAGKYLSPQ